MIRGLGLSPQPSFFYGPHGPEKGITVPVLTRGPWSVDVAATDRWGGAGVERAVGEAVGLFAGAGWDFIASKIEPRVGVALKW